MADSGPLWLPILTIMAFIIVMGAALLALIYLVSTRTTNRFLRTAAPVAVMLLGIIWLKDVDAGDIVAASVLFVAPMAVLIPPFLFPSFTGPRTGIKRIVVCDLVVSLFGSLNYVNPLALGRIRELVAPGGRFFAMLYAPHYTPETYLKSGEFLREYCGNALENLGGRVFEFGNYLIVEGP